jgi:hypothetical protein
LDQAKVRLAYPVDGENAFCDMLFYNLKEPIHIGAANDTCGFRQGIGRATDDSQLQCLIQGFATHQANCDSRHHGVPAAC